MVSREEINRCGDRLRQYWSSGSLEDEEEVLRAWTVVEEFRGGFQYPLQKVTVGVRQFVAGVSQPVLVAQRLKRMPQIVNKLMRLPKSKLARMEDIGGCRAVLQGGGPMVAKVLGRIKANWNVVRVRDYTQDPKPTGYRSVHVVVERDERRIEVQLRTLGQQEWAEAVERAAGRLGCALKDGQGPVEVVEYFRLAAEGIARDEVGLTRDVEFLDRFNQARSMARRHLER